MNYQDESIHKLEARANNALRHIGDIDYLAGHKDEMRALILANAFNGDQVALDGIKEALRHAENALLVWALATGQYGAIDPGTYTVALSTYTIHELAGTLTIPPLKVPLDEEIWAISGLIERHYTPVPYSPFTREQLVKGMKDDD